MIKSSKQQASSQVTRGQPDRMNAVEVAIRKQLEAVCGGLEETYPGLTEAFTSAFFGAQTSAPAKKPRAKKAKKEEPASEVKTESSSEPVAEQSAPSAPAPEAAPEAEKDTASVSEKSAKESSRKRVVSKKMTEAFNALAKEAGKTEEETKTLFEALKKSYKDISDADLQAKGGSFESFAKSFLTGEVPAAPVKEKKVKAKKEKAPSRIAKWTPTLTRTLTKIVEESGSLMTETIKSDFHAWVDAQSEEEFSAIATMEGQMRKFLQTKILGGAGANFPKAAESSAAVAVPQEDDEELEEFEFEGETLCKGVTSGKIYRPMDTGDIWIGNAGVGRFKDITA